MTRRQAPRSRQHGAAILLAMLIMTLVATLAAGMVWLQWRGIEVESAERARGQGEWLLNGALDWGNLILKSSIRNGHPDDDLGQPWATPLADTKLSSFLSADGSHSDDSGPEAFLSGQISDAQAKYNLADLYVDATKTAVERQRLELLCTSIGVPVATADTLAAGLLQSWTAVQGLTSSTPQQASGTAVLMPHQVSDLAWYGIDAGTLKQLEPFVEILPVTAVTTVNANTAPAEVLMAALPGINRADAAQLIQRRAQKPFQSSADVLAALPSYKAPTATNVPGPLVAGTSDYFEVYGQLRYEQHVVRQRSLVWRQSAARVDIIRRERLPPDIQ